MNSPPPTYADPTYEEDNVLEVLNQGDEPLVSPLFQDFHKIVVSAKYRSRLALMVQSPFRLYAYWDVSARQLKKSLRQFPREDRSFFHLVIRCLPPSPHAPAYFDVGATTHWWFDVSPSNNYSVELCLYSAEYGNFPFLISNLVQTPAISLAPMVPSEECSPAPLPLLEQLIQMTGVAFEPVVAQAGIVREPDPIPQRPEPAASLSPPGLPSPLNQDVPPIYGADVVSEEEPLQKTFPKRPPSSEGFWQSEDNA